MVCCIGQPPRLDVRFLIDGHGMYSNAMLFYDNSTACFVSDHLKLIIDHAKRYANETLPNARIQPPFHPTPIQCNATLSRI